MWGNSYKLTFENLTEYVEKMKNNELTLEDVLDNNDIVQDLKTNSSSEFFPFITEEIMKKLIDYATTIPKEDDQKYGHKFPFNATEILTSNNMKIINKYFGIENENNEDNNFEKDINNNDNNNDNINNNINDNINDNIKANDELLKEKKEQFEKMKSILENKLIDKENKIDELKRNLDIQLKNFEKELEKKSCEIEKLQKKSQSDSKIITDLFYFFQQNVNLFNNSKIINCNGNNIKYDENDFSNNEKYSSFIIKTFNNFLCKIMKDNKEMFELLLNYKNIIGQTEEENEKICNQNNYLKMQICDLVNQLSNNQVKNQFNTNNLNNQNFSNQNTNFSTINNPNSPCNNYQNPMKALKNKINELENTIRNQNYDD